MWWTPDRGTRTAGSGRLVLVVDVIRAATSICAALEAGARRVLPAVTVAEAREEAARRRAADEDPWLCGERGGEPPDDFDRGNSPLDYRNADVAGRTLVYTTTNGTRAVRRFSGVAGEIRVVCFANLTAAVALAAERDDGPLVVCAGRGGRPGVDDALCAGHLVREWARARWPAGGEALSASAVAARSLARRLGPPGPGLLALSAAGCALVARGRAAELGACARRDTTRHVPVLRDGVLVPG